MSSSSGEALVVFAGSAWSGMAGTERQLAPFLAEGLRLLWVDPPVSAARAPRRLLRRGLEVDEVQPGVLRLRHVVPPAHTRAGLRQLAAAVRKIVVRRVVRSLSLRPSAVLVACPEDVSGVLPGVPCVLYGTDDWVAGAELMGLRTSRLQRQVRDAVTHATQVLAVSEALAENWARVYDVRPVVVPNGTDPELGAEVDAVQAAGLELRRPVAGFVGHLSDRIDVGLLHAAADQVGTLLLIGLVTRNGPLAGLDRLLARPDVVCVGEIAHRDLPAYYRWIDVGLTPYRDTAFNRASFPLKTLEYLAVGLPVVSTELPANGALEPLGPGILEEARTAADFASAVQRALETAHDPGSIRRRRELARAHGWDRRAEAVLRVLHQVAGAPRTSEELQA